MGGFLIKQRGFSLYDVEEFLKEAGAEHINEKAVVSLEKELEETVKELVGEASLYANYAGRKNIIKSSDVDFLKGNDYGLRQHTVYSTSLKKRIRTRRKQLLRMREMH